jgi:hypothetical protein
MSDGEFSCLFEQVCGQLARYDAGKFAGNGNIDPSVVMEAGDGVWSVIPPQISLYGDVGVLVPLVADRVSLPDELSGVDVLSLLPAEVAVSYRDPSGGMLRPEPLRCKVVPRVLAESHAEYVRLVRRLLALGMSDLVGVDQVKCVNGLFGVAKDDWAIRLILDARPGNCHFVDSPHVRLPSPCDLAALFAPGLAPLFTAKIDLSNFYHHLRLPSWMCDYFCLPAVEVDGRLLHPRLLTLPMGFSHAVYLAQVVNENVLYGGLAPSLSPEHHLLNLRAPAVGMDVVHGAYIDDFGLMSNDEAAVVSAYESCLASYAKCGLVVNVKKSVAPSTAPVELWGVRLSAQGVRVAPEKVLKLIRCTLRLLRRGVATGRELSHAVSSWTWVMLLRRPGLSVFSSVYRFIQVADRACFTLWSSVRKELLNAVLLAPLLFSRLGQEFSGRLLASDACMSGAGMVSSSLRASQFAVLWPLSRDKHGLLREGSSTASCMQPSVSKRRALPGLQQVEEELRAPRWSTVLSYPFRYVPSGEPDSIACLEFRAVLSSVQWLVSLPSCLDTRVVLLVDNSNVYYAMRKGRTSSYALLRVQRRVNALLLASGINVLPCWVPSALNPADGPSRAFEL